MKGYLHDDVAPKEEKVQQDKGPTVTKEHVEKILEGTLVTPFALPEDNPNMTVCYYTLPNGFNGVEYSACVSPKNFDMEIGIQSCIDRIEARIWELEGYLLKQKIYEGDVANGELNT